MEWPEESLQAISQKILAPLPTFSTQSELLEKTIKIIVSVHRELAEKSNEYYTRGGMRVYIPSCKYIELLKVFSELLTKKQNYMDSQLAKYSNGVQCLEEAAGLIKKLTTEINELNPGLEKKNKETEKTLNVIIA